MELKSFRVRYVIEDSKSQTPLSLVLGEKNISLALQKAEIEIQKKLGKVKFVIVLVEQLQLSIFNIH